MGYGINISRIKQTLSHVVSALILFITVKGRYEVCYVFVMWAWDMKNMLTVIVFLRHNMTQTCSRCTLPSFFKKECGPLEAQHKLYRLMLRAIR